MTHYAHTTVTVIALAANGSRTTEKNRPLWTDGHGYAVKWSGKLAPVTFVDAHTAAFELRAPRIAPTTEGRGGRGAAYAGWKPANTADIKAVAGVGAPVARKAPRKGKTQAAPEHAAAPAFLAAQHTVAAKAPRVKAPQPQPAKRERTQAQKLATVRLTEASYAKAKATGDAAKIERARKAYVTACEHAGLHETAAVVTDVAPAPVAKAAKAPRKGKAKAQPQAAQDPLAGKSQDELMAMLDAVTRKLAAG